MRLSSPMNQIAILQIVLYLPAHMSILKNMAWLTYMYNLTAVTCSVIVNECLDFTVIIGKSTRTPQHVHEVRMVGPWWPVSDSDESAPLS